MDPTLKLHANVDVMEHSPLSRDTVTQLNVEPRGDLPLIEGYFDNLKANYLPREAEVNYARAARQAYIDLVSQPSANYYRLNTIPGQGQCTRSVHFKSLPVMKVVLLGTFPSRISRPSSFRRFASPEAL